MDSVSLCLEKVADIVPTVYNDRLLKKEFVEKVDYREANVPKTRPLY